MKTPSRSRPSAEARSSPNHTDPSGATASPVSAAFAVGTGNSVKRPPAYRPILFERNSRNHTAPVASTAISDGPLARVGISISVTWPSGVMRASLLAP